MTTYVDVKGGKMTGKTVLVLGGGFGGLAVAKHLRRQLATENRIIVVEKSETFYLQAYNLRLVTGEMKHPYEGERSISGLESKGIEWVHDNILEIDQNRMRVVTSSAGALYADYIVIALGADKLENKVPGFSEFAYNLYNPYGALRLREALDKFNVGRVAILICSEPYCCPAAPYEVAFLIDSIFRKRGIRHQVEIDNYTPEVRPVPSAGTNMGNAFLGMLNEHNIGFHPRQKVQRIEKHQIYFEDKRVYFDLLVGIPPHVAPEVVRRSGLTDDTGWIPVDIETMRTAYPNIFAIGDVTSVQQPNPTGRFLPKAWVFADAEARVIADNISAQIKGGDMKKRYDGRGFCYVDIDENLTAYASGNFYGYPEPRLYLEQPSKRFLKERRELEKEKIDAFDLPPVGVPVLTSLPQLK